MSVTTSGDQVWEFVSSCIGLAVKLASTSCKAAFFPILVNLAGRKCVVVGAGTVAAAKIEGLLLCDADVVVVSPHAVQAIQRLARAGRLAWRRRAFSRRDVQGKFLAIAATSSGKVNEAVFRACAARGVLCNSVDDPEHCDFIYPAVARRGPLQIAISTGGRSPALAARLRRELERQFGPEWGAWVEHLGRHRDELLKGKMPEKSRRRRLQQMATPKAFRDFLRDGGQTPARKNRG
ncbi:MAG: bifunctional precorrin-2 dehydrogenase/sirohydrochlorin ferrochelatase [Terracidiphilus sp.]|nr:bifunctional precorrin-2 dehydrogenase/sirohydrochlorin ferrochelatase [Terracidiphilus sp.]MDR3796945.1 bifunctional precorrin-2 dehydrogenase/sirohydrochlorin ferrochelatase [Terracidiphilus sp.]